MTALVGTLAGIMREFIIQREEETLFAAFGTPLHPLGLGHYLHRSILSKDVDSLGILLYFDDFLASIL